VFVITRRKLARYYNEAEKHGGVSGLIEFNEDTMSEASTETPADLRLDVAQALDTLEETTREILVLHHFSRYTFGEIALLLDMTESAVRVRHHRAVQTLAEHLTE
jgi:RNA polymerase sigma-70 factor (ECF subfamily)